MSLFALIIKGGMSKNKTVKQECYLSRPLICVKSIKTGLTTEQAIVRFCIYLIMLILLIMFIPIKHLL